MSKFICAIFCCLSISSFAQKEPKESIQFDKPPVIDGQVEDWPGEWWLDPDGKFLSNVGNDAENLYFRLKISDDITQQKIALFGLSLKLNPSGKRKGKVGLKFPVGLDASELKREKPRPLDAGDDLATRIAIKKQWVSDVEVVELIGLVKQNIISSRLGLTNGIEAMLIAQADGSYTYEAKIPFKAFRINKNDVSIMGVEFVTGKLAAPQNRNMNNNSAYSPNSRAPGSSGVGRQPQQQPMYYATTPYNPLHTTGYLWLNVKLK